MFEIVIDTGGTFTDAVLMDEDRKITTAKYPTNVVDPSTGIMGCIELLAQQRHLTVKEVLADTATLVMGTTLSTNCLLEKKGAKCCLIYTKGFRDIPELGTKIWKEDITKNIVKNPGLENQVFSVGISDYSSIVNQSPVCLNSKASLFIEFILTVNRPVLPFIVRSTLLVTVF